MKKTFKRWFLVPLILINMLAAGMLTGCGNSSNKITANQKLKIISDSKEITSIAYSNISNKQNKTDSKIAKVGTLENLLSIYDNMGLLRNEEKSKFFDFIYGFKMDDLESTSESEKASGTDNNTSGHSETNTQVNGVDEADVIKNDGSYIYYLHSNILTIFDAMGEIPKVISEIEISNHSQSFNDIYVVGDTLVLNGTRYEYLNKDGVIIDPYESNSDGTANKIIDPYTNKNFTVFMIYNINDRSKPVYERTVEVEGYTISTRVIGTNLYFVTNKWIPSIIYKEARDFEILPMYKDTLVSEEHILIEPADINYFPESTDSQYMLAGAFDITKKEAVIPQAYLGSGSTIYMNTNSLYISKVTYHYENSIAMADTNIAVPTPVSGLKTEIYRFQIEDTQMNFIGVAEIPGSIINQYSMDEYNGILRVASGENSTGNGITTIDIQTMKKIGEISGLAVNENIYAVRFMGDIGYMVTYRQVDPLFVFDLSNPQNPKKTGELKIPGFSQYLHPVGDKYLVGFGRNTAETFYLNEFGEMVPTGQVRDLGFKLSLFDISDLYDPKEVFVKNYSENSYSDASYNPRSIMVDAGNNIFAFPISRSSDYNYTQGGTVVKIDPEIGFITLADINTEDYIYNTRFSYIGNRLYFISENNIAIFTYPECTFVKEIVY